MNIINIGEDKEITFRLTDSATGLPIVLSSLTGIILVLYYKDSIEVLSKYSLNALTGYETLVITDSVEGRFKIRLKRAVTKLANEGVIHAEVLEENTNADFESSKFRTIRNGIEVGRLQKSTIGKNLTSM